MDADRRDPHELVAPSCPMCGTVYPWDAPACPACGEPRPGVTTDAAKVPPPARTGDIIFAVVVALLAGVLTMPLNVAVTQELWNTADAMLGLIVGTWNTLVWAAPVAIVARWWYVGAKRGDPDKSYLWRIYWKAQIATFGVITALGILLLTICAAAFG